MQENKIVTRWQARTTPKDSDCYLQTPKGSPTLKQPNPVFCFHHLHSLDLRTRLSYPGTGPEARHRTARNPVTPCFCYEHLIFLTTRHQLWTKGCHWFWHIRSLRLLHRGTWRVCWHRTPLPGAGFVPQHHLHSPQVSSSTCTTRSPQEKAAACLISKGNFTPCTESLCPWLSCFPLASAHPAALLLALRATSYHCQVVTVWFSPSLPNGKQKLQVLWCTGQVSRAFLTSLRERLSRATFAKNTTERK